MPQSFTPKGALARTSRSRRKVLVTGASGNIGSYFAQHSHEKYDLRLLVHHADKAGKVQTFGEVVTGDLSNLDKLKEHCRGIDTVVHLAANPSPNAEWDSVLHDNIIGTYNIFAAARSAGCRRVIYASSIHAVSGYPADVQVKTSEPVNPGDLYGVSKCFGEALGRYMAEKEAVSCIAIRIGGFQPIEKARGEIGVSMLDAWVSQRDMNQLIGKCIDAENITFAIVHGMSNNRFKRLDISDTRELVGYEPQDDSTAVNPELKKLRLRHRVRQHNLRDESQKSGMRHETSRAKGRASA